MVRTIKLRKTNSNKCCLVILLSSLLSMYIIHVFYMLEARVHIGIPSNIDGYSSTAGVSYPAHIPTVVDILSKHHMICS